MRKKEDTQTHEKTGATNPLHPSAATNMSLKTGLFLWAWSLHAHDLQDTIGTYPQENSPENRTSDPKCSECSANSTLSVQRHQQPV